jgi:hypothetical protein
MTKKAPPFLPGTTIEIRTESKCENSENRLAHREAVAEYFQGLTIFLVCFSFRENFIDSPAFE